MLFSEICPELPITHSNLYSDTSFFCMCTCPRPESRVLGNDLWSSLMMSGAVCPVEARQIFCAHFYRHGRMRVGMLVAEANGIYCGTTMQEQAILLGLYAAHRATASSEWLLVEVQALANALHSSQPSHISRMFGLQKQHNTMLLCSATDLHRSHSHRGRRIAHPQTSHMETHTAHSGSLVLLPTLLSSGTPCCLKTSPNPPGGHNATSC